MAASANKYEQQRLDNIKRNAEKLSALNIYSTIDKLAASSKRQRIETIPIQVSSEKKSTIGVRRSLRCRGIAPAPEEIPTKSPKIKEPPRDVGPIKMADAFVTSALNNDNRRFIKTILGVPKNSQISGTSNGDKIIGCNSKVLASLRYGPRHITQVWPGRVLSMCFLPSNDRRMVVAGSDNGRLGFWNVDPVDDEDSLYVYQLHHGAVSGIVFEQFSMSKMYTCSSDGYIRLMDVEREIFDLAYVGAQNFFTISSRPNVVESLYVSEGPGKVGVWDKTAGKHSSLWSLHEDRINSIDFNAYNPNLMATSSSDGTACIWDLRKIVVDKPEAIKTVNHKRAVHSACFSPSGSFLATTSVDNTVGLLSGANYDSASMLCHNNSNALRYMDSVWFSPGPRDPTILTQQHEHRSELLWRGEDVPDLTVRVNFRSYWEAVRSHPPPPDVMSAIRSSGLGGVYDIGMHRHDCGLITAFVERWRPETHTFHIPFGEATVTLEDVCYILRVGTSGDAVVHDYQSSSAHDTAVLVGQMFGLVPDGSDITHAGIKIAWLVNNFGKCDRLHEDSVDYDDQLVYHIRAHLLLIIGSLFPNLSGNRLQLQLIYYVADYHRIVNYSWGSAILAYLYDQLCAASRGQRTNIGGCMTLLQVWIWEHFPSLAPMREIDIPFVPPLALRWKCRMSRTAVPKSQSRIIRYELDCLTEDRFIWRPYLNVPEEEMATNRQRSLWRAQCPFICNEIVEWFYPERVCRQFGLIQDIPTISPVADHQQLHAVVNDGCSWQYVHAPYIQLWMNRAAAIYRRTTAVRDRGTTLTYDDWFTSITRRFILEPRQWSRQPGFQGSQRHDQYYREGMSNAIHAIEFSDYTEARDILVERVTNTGSQRYVGEVYSETPPVHTQSVPGRRARRPVPRHDTSAYQATTGSPGWDAAQAGMMAEAFHSTSISGWGQWLGDSSQSHHHHIDDYDFTHTPTQTYGTTHASTGSPRWDEAYTGMISQPMQSSSISGWRQWPDTHVQHSGDYGGGFTDTHGRGFSAFASMQNQFESSSSRTPMGFEHTIPDIHHDTSDEDGDIDHAAHRVQPPRRAKGRGRLCHTGSHIV